jgi:hypothetical protein
MTGQIGHADIAERGLLPSGFYSIAAVGDLPNISKHIVFERPATSRTCRVQTPFNSFPQQRPSRKWNRETVAGSTNGRLSHHLFLVVLIKITSMV